MRRTSAIPLLLASCGLAACANAPGTNGAPTTPAFTIPAPVAGGADAAANVAAAPSGTSVRGPDTTTDPELARQAAMREAADYGMIGLILGPDAGAWNGFDDGGGSPFGSGGLGVDAGGGVTGIRLREVGAVVNGRLPPEVVQRVARQSFGRFRACYEAGLRITPGLAGRVTVRFTIDRDGSVISANDGGSDLPNAAVVACVVAAFGNLSFPQPEGGQVGVTYPITFTP